MNATLVLDMKEIGPGVAEVYAGDLQIGLITWKPNRFSGITSLWYATYGDETVTCTCTNQALEVLRLQHAAVQRFARSLRSIRPAPEQGNGPQKLADKSYNQALRDVERVTQKVVGTAPDGEGFTAITRPN